MPRLVGGVGIIRATDASPQTLLVAGVPTDASIRAAVAQCIAAGGPWEIRIGDAGASGCTLTSPLPWISGISYVGVQPTFTHSSSVADNDFTFTGGTWFKGDGTFPCFQAQTTAYAALDTDKGSPDANFTTTGIKEANISNIGMGGGAGLGFTKGLSVGAKNQCGLLYSRVENIWVRDNHAASSVYSATHWAGMFQNCQHCHFSGLWSYNNSNSWFFSSSVASTVLQCGNFVCDTLYHNPGTVLSAANRRKSRGIVFTGEYDGFLNEVYATRLQVNRFTMTQASETATLSAGTSVQVADSSIYTVGMPVVFTTTRGNVTADETKFVLSIVDGTNITVGLARNTAALTGAAGTSVLKTWGMPNFEVYGNRVLGAATTSKVTSSVFDGLDMEGDSSAQFYIEAGVSNQFRIAQVGNSVATVHKHIVLRGSDTNNIVCGDTVGLDIDGPSALTTFNGTVNYTQSYPNGLTAVTTNSAPIGIHRNSINGDRVLSLNQYRGGLIGRVGSGSGWMLPSLPVGSNYTAWPFAAGTLDSSHGSTVVCYSQAATSITLPTIDSTGTNADNVGWRCRIFNQNTGLLTVNCANAKTVNGMAGKTSFTLAAATATDLAYADVQLANVNGVQIYLVTLGVAAYGTATATQGAGSGKATGVTMSAASGLLTLDGASLAADTSISFTLTNTFITANDSLLIQHSSVGTLGAYSFAASTGSGTATVTIHNLTPGALAQAIIVRVQVIKAL